MAPNRFLLVAVVLQRGRKQHQSLDDKTHEFTEAEQRATLREYAGLPFLLRHKESDRLNGRVQRAWIDNLGRTLVLGEIHTTDEKTRKVCADIQNAGLTQVSLCHQFVEHNGVVTKTLKEVSICRQGKRPQTHILYFQPDNGTRTEDEIVSFFSAGGLMYTGAGYVACSADDLADEDGFAIAPPGQEQRFAHLGHNLYILDPGTPEDSDTAMNGASAQPHPDDSQVVETIERAPAGPNKRAAPEDTEASAPASASVPVPVPDAAPETPAAKAPRAYRVADKRPEELESMALAKAAQQRIAQLEALNKQLMREKDEHEHRNEIASFKGECDELMSRVRAAGVFDVADYEADVATLLNDMTNAKTPEERRQLKRELANFKSSATRSIKAAQTMLSTLDSRFESRFQTTGAPAAAATPAPTPARRGIAANSADTDDANMDGDAAPAVNPYKFTYGQIAAFVEKKKFASMGEVACSADERAEVEHVLTLGDSGQITNVCKHALVNAFNYLPGREFAAGIRKFITSPNAEDFLRAREEMEKRAGIKRRGGAF